MPQKLILTWDDLKRDVQTLAQQLKDQAPWKGIVAITRGGMVPSCLLSYHLNLRVVDTISIASYGDDHVQRELKVLKAPEIPGGGKGWLVIDDLVDTGHTTTLVKKVLPHAYQAVVYAKPEGKPLVDCFVRDVSQDTWIVFPWEQI